jgi:hypothetical protein
MDIKEVKILIGDLVIAQREAQLEAEQLRAVIAELEKELKKGENNEKLV